MKQITTLVVVVLFPFVLSAGGKVKLNVKTGLWQTTTTRTVTGGMGLPPELAAEMTPAQRTRFEAAAKKRGSGTPRTETSKDCLTAEKLAEDPFSTKPHGENVKCQETVIQSTSADLEIRAVCTYGSSKGNFHFSFHADNPEHVTGSATTTLTMGGREMNTVTKVDSKWISGACPAGTK